MTVYQHHHQVDWLPHIRDTTPDEALRRFQEMYRDSSSPLGRLCQGCDWWIMWARDEEGKTANPQGTAYLRCVPLPAEAEAPGAGPAETVTARVSLPLVPPPSALPAAASSIAAPPAKQPQAGASARRLLGQVWRRTGGRVLNGFRRRFGGARKAG
jgi:hypothetical protein